MDTSVGLSSIATLSLGLSMSMAGAGRVVIRSLQGGNVPNQAVVDRRQSTIHQLFPVLPTALEPLLNSLDSNQKQRQSSDQMTKVQKSFQKQRSLSSKELPTEQSKLLQPNSPNKNFPAPFLRASSLDSQAMKSPSRLVAEKGPSNKGDSVRFSPRLQCKFMSSLKEDELNENDDNEPCLKQVSTSESPTIKAECDTLSSHLGPGMLSRTNTDASTDSGNFITIPDVIIHAAEAWTASDCSVAEQASYMNNCPKETEKQLASTGRLPSESTSLPQLSLKLSSYSNHLSSLTSFNSSRDALEEDRVDSHFLPTLRKNETNNQNSINQDETLCNSFQPENIITALPSQTSPPLKKSSLHPRRGKFSRASLDSSNLAFKFNFDFKSQKQQFESLQKTKITRQSGTKPIHSSKDPVKTQTSQVLLPSLQTSSSSVSSLSSSSSSSNPSVVSPSSALCNFFLKHHHHNYHKPRGLRDFRCKLSNFQKQVSLDVPVEKSLVDEPSFKTFKGFWISPSKSCPKQIVLDRPEDISNRTRLLIDSATQTNFTDIHKWESGARQNYFCSSFLSAVTSAAPLSHTTSVDFNLQAGSRQLASIRRKLSHDSVILEYEYLNARKKSLRKKAFSSNSSRSRSNLIKLIKPNEHKIEKQSEQNQKLNHLTTDCTLINKQRQGDYEKSHKPANNLKSKNTKNTRAKPREAVWSRSQELPIRTPVSVENGLSSPTVLESPRRLSMNLPRGKLVEL